MAKQVEENTDPYISVQMPQQMKRYLSIRAGVLGISRSALIRQLVEADSAAHPDDYKRASKEV